MNHAFKLIWSRTLGMLIPVAEVMRTVGHGGRRLSPRALRRLALRRGLAGVAGSVALVLVPAVALALPQGGQVTAGAASIARSGNTLTVTQTSGKTAINWQGFSIGAGQSVQFRQPGASSVALNQVLGSDPSQIYGHLTANGQVFLVNPNGVYFAPGASVDVGGLVASTRAITDRDFMAGKYHFTGTSTASVVNRGTIKAAEGGYVAFIGGQVDNAGRIVAPGGTVALGAGGTIDLTLAGGSLVHFEVSRAALSAEVKNGGAIIAQGGVVLLSAAAKDALLRTVVNQSGIVEAGSATLQGGTITLLGGSSGTVSVSGRLDASSATGAGGAVAVSGAHVVVAHGGRIVATGAIRGGTIAVGGGVHGAGSLPPARTVRLASGAVLDARATRAGAGGVVSVWSDVKNPASVTKVAGTILASGAGGGQGGFVETSGHRLDITGAAVRTGGGTWLLDPYNVTIASSNASGTAFSSNYKPGSASTILNTSIETALNAGNKVVIQTTGTAGSSNGNITVNAPIAWSTGAGLTLNAAGNIAINAPISASGSAPSLTLEYGQSSANGAGASYSIAAPVSLPGNAGFVTQAGSSGVAISYTVVDTQAALEAISGTGNYALGASVTATGTNSPIPSFSGTFEGLGNTISNLTITGGNNVGLFGTLGSFGVIRDVGLVGESVTGTSLVGGLVGNNTYGGTISASYVTGTVSASGYGVGGLVGDNGYAGSVTASFASATVTGSSTDVGGLVGLNTNQGVISASHASGNVTGTGNYVGGLVGYNNSGNIAASYATGSVAGASSDVGGLVGVHYNGTIAGSYATGQVTGFANVGGLVGYNGSALTDSYAASISVSGKSGNVGGLVGDNAGNITASYAVGSVSGNADLGGLVGYNIGAIGSSYWDTTASGTMTGTGFGSGSGVAGLSTQEWLTQGPIATGVFSSSTWVAGYPYPVLKALPYVVVNATSAQATYGDQTQPSFTVSSVANQGGVVSGVVNTSGVQFFSLPAATTSSGTYFVGGSGASLDRGQSGYQITYDGSLTIKQASLTITPGNQSKTYGETLALGTTDFTASGLLNNDTVSSVTLSSAGTAAAASVAGGPYAITGSNAQGTGLSNYTISYDTGALTINKAAMSVTGEVASNKVYDGTTVATLSGGTLVGVFAADIGNVTLSEAGSFAGPNVGSGITVKANDSLGGVAAGNYSLIQSTGLAANITPEAITVTALSNSKVYDGTTSAAAAPIVTSGTLYAVNTGTLSESYTTANAGQSLTLAPTLTGLADAADYAISYVNNTSGVIAQAPLSVTGEVASNKVYDGTTVATLSGGMLAGVIAADFGKVTLSDAGSFAGPNVGNGIAVTASDALGGVAAGNYSLTQPTGLVANITPEAITVTALSNSKVYDGTTSAAAAPIVTSGTLYAVNTGTLAESYTTPTAGQSLTLAPTLTGLADAADYAISYVNNTSGVIAQAPLSVTGEVAANKVYDGTTSAALTGGTLAGVIAADFGKVTLNEAGSFVSVHAASGIAVRVSDSLGGVAAGNYSLTQPSGLAANITPEAITVTALSNSKVYDGTTSAAAAPIVTSGTLYAVNTGTLSESYTTANAGQSLTLAPTLTGLADAADYAISYVNNTSGVITPAQLTVTGEVAANKVYDGTTGATLSGGTLAGVIVSDIGNVTLSDAGSFASANVGSGVAVRVSDTLGGSASGNYTLSQPTTLAANITPEAITVTALSNSKVYDGTTSAAAAPIVTSGTLYAVNTGTLAESYTTPNAGQSLTLAPTLTGLADAADYAISYVNNTSGLITPAQLAVTGEVAANKVYDGTTSVALSDGVLSGVIGSDIGKVTLSEAGSFVSANAGNGIAVTVNDSLGGSAVGNYALIQPVGLVADITPKALTVTPGNLSKTYGQTVDLGTTDFTVIGLVHNDTVSNVTLGSAGATATAMVGASPYAIIASNATGTGLPNYTITYATGALTVNPAALTITPGNQSKTFGQTLDLGTTNFTATGLLNNDSVTGVTLASTGAAAAAAAVPVPYAITGSAAVGQGLGNYTISYGTGSLTVTPTTSAATSGSAPSSKVQSVHISVCTTGSLASCVGMTVSGVGVNLSGQTVSITTFPPPWMISGLSEPRLQATPSRRG
ncbi:YDG domain-containing protein [Acidiphilium sp. C61]|uniref:YDG domain-containing protein n=1 Tax=Acidiphilium sp. C61 TaxID=1671485 RepID=UPI00157A89C4|nr:YDG domain-containing protein [Acidiphilium sp. C61]